MSADAGDIEVERVPVAPATAAAVRPSAAGGSVAIAVSLVIPTRDEARNVGWVLERVPRYVDEVIVVDGLSTDGTLEAALAVRPDARPVHVTAPGKGAALRAGFAHARGEFIVMLDGDGSMDPREIGRYVARLSEGYDLVKGSRFMAQGGTADISRLRAVGNLTLLAMANRRFGSRFTELCYGFMAFRRDVLPELALTADGFEIEAQIVVNAVRAGLRVAEVPSFESRRRNGRSHLRTFRDGRRVARELVSRGRQAGVSAGPVPRAPAWPPPSPASPTVVLADQLQGEPGSGCSA